MRLHYFEKCARIELPKLLNYVFIRSVNYCHKELHFTWNKVFKNGPSNICGRQPLKTLKGYGMLKQTAVFHKF